MQQASRVARARAATSVTSRTTSTTSAVNKIVLLPRGSCSSFGTTTSPAQGLGQLPGKIAIDALPPGRFVVAQSRILPCSPATPSVSSTSSSSRGAATWSTTRQGKIKTAARPLELDSLSRSARTMATSSTQLVQSLSSSSTSCRNSSSRSGSSSSLSSCCTVSARTTTTSRGFASASPTSGATAGLGPQATYDELLAKGKINEDPNQKVIVARLEELAEKIKGYTPAPAASPAASSPPASGSGGGGFFASLFGGGGAAKPEPASPAGAPEKFTAPTGLYIWGGCGSGKSFLMDLFYDTQTHIEKKRRVHFHEWLIEVHDRLHKKTISSAGVHAKADSEWSATAAKAQRESLQAASGDNAENKADIMNAIADDMIEEAWLYCFDEFQVTHISDAMIMKQLFSILFQKGAVVVSTSNRPPEDLYLNGLNRPLFLPFIPLLKERCEVLDIASQTDYRLITDYAEDAFQVFFSPIDEKQRGFFDGKFHRATRDQVLQDQELEVQGRKMHIPKMGEKVKCALFDFKDLCDKPLGAADYISIAKTFHTVFIDNIPALSLQERDQYPEYRKVRRFITLIDNLYEQRTKFVLLSEKKAHEIFTVDPSIDKKTAIQDEIFAWDRTVSRLTEMSSQEYLRERSRELPLEQFWHQYDLKKYTDEEIDEIWQRFDDDLSGELDRDEMVIVLREIRAFLGHKEYMNTGISTTPPNFFLQPEFGKKKAETLGKNSTALLCSLPSVLAATTDAAVVREAMLLLVLLLLRKAASCIRGRTRFSSRMKPALGLCPVAHARSFLSTYPTAIKFFFFSIHTTHQTNRRMGDGLEGV
ncbi:unnamed protein product [Amoebophrya sp. A120]|nr:unnamed protein product [Amoebophrya sp. A120]|eukprot:GSA120T00001006001.1